MPKHSRKRYSHLRSPGRQSAGALLVWQIPCAQKTKDTLARLRKLGIGKTLLITGDSPEAARPIAKELRIS